MNNLLSGIAVASRISQWQRRRVVCLDCLFSLTAKMIDSLSAPQQLHSPEVESNKMRSTVLAVRRFRGAR